MGIYVVIVEFNVEEEAFYGNSKFDSIHVHKVDAERRYQEIIKGINLTDAFSMARDIHIDKQKDGNISYFYPVIVPYHLDLQTMLFP